MKIIFTDFEKTFIKSMSIFFIICYFISIYVCIFYINNKKLNNNLPVKSNIIHTNYNEVICPDCGKHIIFISDDNIIDEFDVNILESENEL